MMDRRTIVREAAFTTPPLPRAVDLSTLPRAARRPGGASRTPGGDAERQASFCRRRNAGTSSGDAGSNSAPGLIMSVGRIGRRGGDAASRGPGAARTTGARRAAATPTAATFSTVSVRSAVYELQVDRRLRGRRRSAAARRHAAVEAGRDHRDLHLAFQLRIDDRAEDDVRVLVRRFLDDRRRLAHFDQRQVRTAGDVDDHAARALDRRVLEQRARDRARWRRPSRGPRLRRGRCP